MTRYRLTLIGPFGLFGPDGRRIEISSQKGMALIALIAMATGGVRSRRKLEAMLWEHRAPKQAQDSLRRELSNLRKLLARNGAADLLVSETKRVALAIDRIEVDVFSLGLTTPGSSMGRVGEFLEGLDLPGSDAFEDWLRDERDRVRDMMALSIHKPVMPERAPAEVYGETLPSGIEALTSTEPPLPPKPSVAVLPFSTPGAPGQGWLGAAMADEVSVCLSAFPQLFIVSSNAARTLSEAGLSSAEIARRLGVRYLLEGSIVRQDERLRVSSALLDAGTGEQFWAETFLGQADDTFTLQQQIATRIAPRIWSKVDSAERQRSLRITSPPCGDYERYWRANALSRSWNRDAIAEAVDLAWDLVERHPTCPWATSLAAYIHSVAWMLRLSPDREAALRRAIQNLQAALRYGEDNVEALGYCVGTILNIGGDIELAERLAARALDLLPTHQPALFWGGWVDVLRGDPERAIQRFELAIRINPVSGAMAQTLAGIGFAQILLGRFAQALDYLRNAEKLGPEFPPTRLGMVVAAELSGDRALARACAAPLVAAGSLGMAELLRRPEHKRLFREAIQRVLTAPSSLPATQRASAA